MPNALIADDNFHNRNVCKLALNHVGFDSIEAEDGEEALVLLASQDFDLLLLDLSMPKLGGIEVLREIETMGLTDKMRVVVITAHSQLATEVQELADFVMYKPIDIMLFSTFLQRLYPVKMG